MVRIHWALISVACLGLLTVSVVPSWLAGGEESFLSGARPAYAEAGVASAIAASDRVYDRFLQRFERLRNHAERRRRIATEVERAARQDHIPPDLLFAVIAVESRFDPNAVSSGGAHGLGQALFSTAKAVAPNVVHRPSDLHNVRHNLTVSARCLKELLDEWDGDIRDALLAYHAGPEGPKKHGPDPYVNRVRTYLAALKEDRGEAAG